MAVVAGVFRRNNVFWWRRRFPQELRRVVARRDLRVSLRTHLPDTARSRAVRLRAATDAVFEGVLAAMAAGRELDEAEIDALVRDAVERELAAAERERELGPPRDADGVAASVQAIRARRERLHQQLQQRQYREVEPVVQDTLSAAGHGHAPDSPSGRMLRRRTTRQLAAALVDEEKREQGIYPEDLPAGSADDPVGGVGPITVQAPAANEAGDREPKRGGQPADRAASVVAGPSETGGDTAGESTSAPMTPTLELSKEASATSDKAVTRSRTPATSLWCAWNAMIAETSSGMARKHEVLQRMMYEAFGDPAPSEITRDQLLEFRELLERLPKNHGKGKAGKIPIRDLVDSTDQKEKDQREAVHTRYEAGHIDRKTRDLQLDGAKVQRVAPSMVNRHLERISGLSAFLRRQGYISAPLPIDGVRLTNRRLERREREQQPTDRKPWGIDGLQRLFTSEVFTNAANRTVDEPLFWAPLMAVTMGLRSEEALQVKVEDLQRLEGVLCLRVRAGSGQRIKTRESERDLPVPHLLIQAGIETLAKRQKAQGHTWLFPNIDRGAAEGSFTDNFSKRFRRYREKHGLYDPHRDFHSLRHDFNVLLYRAKVPKPARQHLMGHKISDITDGDYNKDGETVLQRRDHINAIDFGLGVKFEGEIPVLYLREGASDEDAEDHVVEAGFAEAAE